MTDSERKDRLTSCPGIILDCCAEVIGELPSASGGRGKDISDLAELVGRDGAAKLADFCASPPVPGTDPASKTANTALFRLNSDEYPYGAAVKDRRFSGERRVFYLIGKNESELIDAMKRDEYPFDARDLPELGRTVGVRGGLTAAGGFSALTGTIVRRISAFPELSCGDVSFSAECEEPARVSLSVAAYTDAAALLISSLNASSASHRSEVRVVERADGAEISILTDDADLLRLFGRSPDVSLLPSLLPPCFEKLSLAVYLCGVAGIRLETAADAKSGRCGFRLSVTTHVDGAEFKNVGMVRTEDLILELARFIRRSDLRR